jgi:hypothetical protein
MLTNKQIAITRLVDARIKGYRHLELIRSILPQVEYLQAVEPNREYIYVNEPYIFNICAIKKDLMVPIWVQYQGNIRPIGTRAHLPLEIGPQLIERYYHFLTYNP